MSLRSARILLFAAPFIAAFCIAGPTRVNAQESRPEIRWDKYHLFDEVTSYSRYLANEYPNLVSLESEGLTTMKQRDIWVLTITNRETGAPEDKPGFFLDGGTHNQEYGGSETCLYTAWYLATQYGNDPEVTELLDTRAIYIMPRKDADGMEVHLTNVVDYDPADVPFPVDADFDGRVGEDGPSDVDGDGEILRMRIEDPDGGWVASRDDPRIMHHRQDSDTPPFYRMMTEGRDDDGDGAVNEDPPVTRFSSNRNYPGAWSNRLSTQRGEGNYPAQELETRATVDFVYAHPNIAGMQSLHHYAGAILRPFSNLGPETWPIQDRVYHDVIAQRGRELTDYGYIDIYESFTGDKSNPRYGVQVDWGYLDVGVISFTTEQWRYSGNIGPTGEWWSATEEEQMVTNDERWGGRHFVNWRSYDHPDLGPVELGGWKKFTIRNPPAEIMEEEMLIPNMKFILYHASTTPLIRVSDLEATPIEGVYRIEATIANEGLLPSYVTLQALRSRNILQGPVAKQVVAEIETGPGVTLQSAERRLVLGHLEGFPPSVKEYSFGTQTFGGDNQRTIEWFVTGSGDVTVRASAEKGGRHSRTVTVGGR